MASCFVTEFGQLTPTPNGVAAIADMGSKLAEQVITIGTVVSSNPFNPATSVIRVHAAAICSIEVGLNPVATASTARLAANQTEYFGVPHNSGWSISVITNS